MRIFPHYGGGGNLVVAPVRVGAGETWGGVPARPIPREEMERLKRVIRGERES